MTFNNAQTRYRRPSKADFYEFPGSFCSSRNDSGKYRGAYKHVWRMLRESFLKPKNLFMSHYFR